MLTEEKMEHRWTDGKFQKRNSYKEPNGIFLDIEDLDYTISE